MQKDEEEVIRAIHHEDVEEFFRSLRLYEKLERGEIQCTVCGGTISIDNFRAVARKSSNLLFCCDKEFCIIELSRILRGRRE